MKRGYEVIAEEKNTGKPIGKGKFFFQKKQWH
jgi:hypothetical protein